MVVALIRLVFLSVSGSLCRVKGTCAVTLSTYIIVILRLLKKKIKKVFHEFLFQVCLIINTGKTVAAWNIAITIYFRHSPNPIFIVKI